MDKLEISRWLSDLKHGDSSAREQAAFELGKLRDLSTVPALTVALFDEKLFVGKRAAEALDKMGVSGLLTIAKTLRDETMSFGDAPSNFLAISETRMRFRF